MNRFRNRNRRRNGIIANNRIRAHRVRLIGSSGKQIGIEGTKSALNKARMAKLDLVLVAPRAKPPVAKIMDYGKFRFQQQKRNKKIRRKNRATRLKQIRLSTVIGKNDLKTKQNQAKHFIHKGAKVRVSLWFKGRAITHKEVGYHVLMNFAKGLSKVAQMTQKPKMDGRNMFLMLTPNDVKKKN